MNKIVVVPDASLKQPAHHHHKKKSCVNKSKKDGPWQEQQQQQQLQDGRLSRDYESWVPLDYSVAQLKQDVMRYWCLPPSKHYQLYDQNDRPLAGEWHLDFLSNYEDNPTKTTFALKRTLGRSAGDCLMTSSSSLKSSSTLTSTWALHTPTPTSSQDPASTGDTTSKLDPFWIQEKLFELFLFYALQNMTGKVLWVTCYQFKSLLQKATTAKKSAAVHKQKKKTHRKLELDTRVLLAFKGAVPNSGGGAGTTFDEFLDALVDVAGFLFPKLSSKELAFEKLVTKVVIPQYESEQYSGNGKSSLSWAQMDALLAKHSVNSLIQQFAKPIGDLAACYSTTIGGARAYRGLQFHEFSKFVHEIKPKWFSMTCNELCDVFIRCCRVELRQQYSETTTLASLYFSNSSTSRNSSFSNTFPPTLSGSFDALSKSSFTVSRSGNAGGNFTTHGGGTNSATSGGGGPGRGSNPMTESGGALEILCAKMMSVFGYLALITVPPLAKINDPQQQLRKVNFSTMDLASSSSSNNNTLASLSVKAFLHHIANHLSGKSLHHTKKNAAFALARVHFLHEFHKMHQEDAMNDYLSALAKEIRAMHLLAISANQEAIKREVASNNVPQMGNVAVNSAFRQNGESVREDEGFDLSLDWGDNDEGGDEGDDSSDENESMDSRSLASLDPLLLEARCRRELEDLAGVLNEGDEIYSFLTSELQRHVLLDKCIDDTETVSQMLDMWVAAGQKYAQVISHVESSSLSASTTGATKAGFLQRFGCSLYVFARQLLTNTTKVYAYEELFAITNARVYGVKSAFWDDTSLVFTTDLAMETLSLASGKLTIACAEYIQLFSEDDANEDGALRIHPADSGDGDEVRGDNEGTTGMMYEKYLECLFHRANCLTGYGDILAHNTLCMKDYELGCLLEEELEGLHQTGGSSSGSQSRAGSPLPFEEYRSASALSKTSPPGQFYREANRIYRFVASHFITSTAARNKARFPLFKVHHELSMTQFKLATHLPPGCVAEKKLLEEALVNLAICQKLQKVPEAELETLAKKKEYISAILVLRHKFFQPEGLPNAATAAKQNGSASGKQYNHMFPNEELIAPFYRFVLAAAFKDFDGGSTGLLTQKDLSELNKACGRGRVSEVAMHWLLLNFDHQGDALTEKGLLQYFCWIAEADPLAFCEILDIFTSKYTETHHASITTSRPSHISKEPKAKSLRSILFAERRQQTTSSSSSSPSTGKNRHRPSISAKKGIAENLRRPEQNQVPVGHSSGPQVIDVLPSTASLPDELSKFCFPDDVFLYDEPLPPKTSDIVLTDIKGDRLYGSCLHFYEEKDPMDVLALISGVQKGRTASLPSWISLRDIQQHKTRWKCFVPKCLCVLSSFPLFQTFREFLTQLYRLSLSGPLPSSLVESLVFNLVEEIPLPLSNLEQTSFRLMNRTCLLTGSASGLPVLYPAEVDFTILFRCLNPENILKNTVVVLVGVPQVYAFLLTEKKLVVCSSNYSILTPVAETLRALLHPFECQVVYIPVLPLSLLDFVSAPVPFFMGVRSDKRVDSLISEGVVVVDLDKNEVLLPPNELMPSLPDVKAKKLLQALRKVTYWASSQKSKDQFGQYKDGELSAIRPLDQSDRALDSDVAQLMKRHDELIEKWSELQALFSNFATRLLKDFRKYCSKISPSPTASNETIVFDKRGFLTMHPSLREFCTHLFQTQLFQRFIERSALDGGITGAEQEVSWLSVRSKSVIWKSEPAEEAAKAPIRQIVRAPSPFSRDGKLIQPNQRSSFTQQRRTSLSGTDAFPMFNVHAYEELLSRISKSMAAEARSAQYLLQSAGSPSVSASSSAESSKSSLSFHIGDSPASKLVSAARHRLETANSVE